MLLGVSLVNKRLCQPWPLDWHSMYIVFLQSLLPLAAKAKPASAGLPAPASHGWLCCRAHIVATFQPKTLCIFPGSCLFPSEASTLSSALVRSPRRRPPVLSTWTTTKRNKEMTVHGEDDSRDPAARVVLLVFGTEKGINWVVRELWPV